MTVYWSVQITPKMLLFFSITGAFLPTIRLRVVPNFSAEAR